MSDKTPEFFTDEFGNSYFLAYRNEAGSAYRVVPCEGTSPLANAPRSDEERRELVRQFGSIENFGVALLDIVERLNRAVPYGLEDFAVLVDAADEIERLRERVSELINRLHDVNEEAMRARARADDLARENERLARQVAKEFIPHPTSWLNGRRWEDDIDGELGPQLASRSAPGMGVIRAIMQGQQGELG